MTETEQETQETPDEATESPETPDDPETAPATPDETDSPQEPADEPTGSLTKEQHDEIHVKLAKRADNYFKSVKEIGAAELGTLTVCELCADSYPGLRDLRLDPTVIDRVGAALFGRPSLENLSLDPHTRRCDSCAGYGVVRTDSLVFGQESRTCRACNGSGYTALDQQTGVMVAPKQENGTPVAEVVAGVNPNDPDIARLIADGYTIVPPLQSIAMGQEG